MTTEAHTPEEIAGRLTPARKRMVLALPDDGEWGAVPDRRIAVRCWYSDLYIINRRHCPTDRNEWRLNDKGLAVRAALTGAAQ